MRGVLGWCLLAGLVISVMSAMAFAWLVDPDHETAISFTMPQDYHCGRIWTRPDHTSTTAAGLGLEIETITWRHTGGSPVTDHRPRWATITPCVESDEVTAVVAGLPFRCLIAQGRRPHTAAHEQAAVVRWRGGLEVTRPFGKTRDRILPVRPLLPGLLGNTLVWAGAVLVLLACFRGSRRSLRRRRGGCPSCGYAIGASDAPCPECGRSGGASSSSEPAA